MPPQLPVQHPQQVAVSLYLPLALTLFFATSAGYACVQTRRAMKNPQDCPMLPNAGGALWIFLYLWREKRNVL